MEWTEQDEGDGLDGDVADESTAYVEFLHQEVSNPVRSVDNHGYKILIYYSTRL